MSTLRVITKTISPPALRHNWRQIRKRSHARRLLAVIKSDAYGHGLLPVADALADEVDGFAVVRLQDAVELRQHNITCPIVLLQGLLVPASTTLLADYQLTPVIHTDWHIQALAALPASAGLTVYVKVNTGMNRLGFEPAQLSGVLETLSQTRAIKNIVLMTHFANADEPNGLTTALATLQPLRAQAGNVPLSLGNSAATLLHGDIGDDIARVGIALYGASPAAQWHSRAALGLRAAMTFTTRLISVRDITAGARVGYGGEYTATAAQRIGIASAGYGDGYPRRNGMYVQINETIAPVIGRVSMEMIAIDLSAVPAATVGDEVILWGDTPAADEVATAAGTIAYELFTGAKGEYRLDTAARDSA